ncbi:putative glycoside hydrolase, family 27 [Lupinus albus]|uniref:Putative glycoside hydrolase, family 27 n=1 Tax=Lupinus albus TaxID=3870 RepID=A0A6A4QL53_LUPAL|nr:putative glycoside hydrolase, family 27 [Lupinus albus]
MHIYAVVDYLWYRSLNGGSNSRGNDIIDEWGRLNPDAKRWPSSVGWKGFKNVADKVHGMGLKFGIHLMAGISTQAYDANTPILDTKTVCFFFLSYSNYHFCYYNVANSNLSFKLH